MKHGIKDGLIILCLALILATSGFLTYLLSPVIFDAFGGLGPVVVLVAFLLIAGLMNVAYFRAVSLVAPPKPGEYPMDHVQVWLWKQNTLVRDMAERFLKPFFPLFLGGLYYRLLGVQMGADATVAAKGIVADPLLTRMGAHAVIGENACVTAHVIVNGTLILDPIVIGAGATVGIGAVVMPGARIGEGAVVAPGAVLSPGTEVPAFEMWGGVPAKKIKEMKNEECRMRNGPETAGAPVGEMEAA